MDKLANAIGWLVIIFGGIYFIGKIADSFSSAREAELEKVVSTWRHMCMIAYRKMYFSTDDAAVKGAVKSHCGSWAFLYLDLDDDAYDQKMRLQDHSGAYAAAVARIQAEGFPYVLHGNNVVRNHVVINR